MKSRSIKKYSCDYCEDLFDKSFECKEHEIECKKHHIISIKENIIPRNWNNDKNWDSQYEKHCVLCGKKLIEYDYIIDPVRCYPGKIIFEDKNYTKMFGSLVCDKCNKKHKTRISNELHKIGYFSI